MMNTQSKSSDPVQAASINLGTDENEVKREFELYRQLQFHMQKIISSFNSLSAGVIDSITDLKTAMDKGGKEFLEDVLFKLSGKDVKIGGLTILKSKLPDLLISGDKESFYRACDDAKAMQAKNNFLIDDFFTIEGEKIILQDQDLQKHLQEKYTHYLTDPNEIELHEKILAFTKAWNDLKPHGLSLRNPGQYVEHIDTEASDMKAKFPFTPSWK